MSLGDLVVSLSANTARFEADMGKANQITEKWANAFIKNSQQAERAIKELSDVGRTSMDRLQQSFNTLDIKSKLQIDREANNIRNAFKRIETSGVATFDEIKRAKAAMDRKLSDISGEGNVMKGHIEGMNGFSLASVAAIAKIQILYSLINQTMSAIGSIPGTAIDSIENFKSSIVSNAAIITSMQGGVQDVGKAYRENKVYAEALEKVLIRMDTETSASYEQLQLMNTAFINQGAILDINNAKAVEGYKSVAQAISVIAKMSNNPNQQFTQEAKALFSGEMKAGNQLLNILAGIDPKIKEHLALWKQQGTVFENLNPLLRGYAAAQGDIDNMWQTIKSTMATIRDEVLREGLQEGFQEILDTMKAMSKYAQENKEKIQAMLKEGFADAKAVAKFIWEWRDGIKAVGETALWGGLLYGIASVILKLEEMRKTILAINVATGSGLLPKIMALGGGAVAGATGMIVGAGILGKGLYDVSKAQDEANLIKAHLGPNENADALGGQALIWMRQLKPMADTAALQRMYQQGIFKAIPRNDGGENDSPYDAYNPYRITYNKELDNKINSATAAAVVPKVKTNAKTGKGGSDTDTYNAFDNDHYKELVKNITDYNKKLGEQEKGFYDLSVEMDRTMEAEKGLFNIKNMQTGDLTTSRYNVTNPMETPYLQIESFAKSFAKELEDETAKYGALNPNKRANYRLMTNDQYSIPMSKDAFLDPRKASDNKEWADNMSFNMTNSTKIAQGLDFEAANDKLYKEADDREKEIMKKGLTNQEEIQKLKKESMDKYIADKAALDKKAQDSAVQQLEANLSTISGILMRGNKEQFEAGKKFAIAAAIVNTYLAASNAFKGSSAIPGPWGVAMGVASAAVAVAAGMAQVSQISSQQYEGREFGGPVTAGQTYVVGEKRPELFTPGVSGTITPYVPAAGRAEPSITMVNNFSADMSDTVRAEIYNALPLIRSQALTAVQAAQRSGQM